MDASDGVFVQVGASAREPLARLNADGSVDASFNPSAVGVVEGLGVHADGRLVVTGGFSTINGQARHHIARLNANGSVTALSIRTPTATASPPSSCKRTAVAVSRL